MIIIPAILLSEDRVRAGLTICIIAGGIICAIAVAIIIVCSDNEYSDVTVKPKVADITYADWMRLNSRPYKVDSD